jgi:hypothetical protein
MIGRPAARRRVRSDSGRLRDRDGHPGPDGWWDFDVGGRLREAILAGIMAMIGVASKG